MDIRSQTARPATSTFYTVAGRSLCVEAPDAWSAHVFEQYFAGWYVAPAHTSARCTPDATIRVRTDEAAPRVPAGLHSFAVAAGGRCHTNGETYYLEADGSQVVVHSGARALVEVWVGASQQSRRKAPLARLVFNATMAALRRCGLYELHGGGVHDARRGAGVLFVGPSGSGKSTLTTQLAASGWHYLSDDSLLLSETGGDVEARGLRRVFAVTETTVESAGVSRLRQVTTDPVPFDPLKRRFEPRTLFPAGHVEACIPRALFFPRVTHQPESRVRRLSQHEAMTRLLKICPWACYDRPAARAHLRVLARLSRQSAAYELRAGTDLLGRPDYTADLIDSYLEAATS